MNRWGHAYLDITVPKYSPGLLETMRNWHLIHKQPAATLDSRITKNRTKRLHAAMVKTVCPAMLGKVGKLIELCITGGLMFFKRKREETEGGGVSVIVKNETSEQCLDPDKLSENLTLALSKKMNGTSGHIHIHFRGKSDHLIIVWSHGRLREIVAKSQGCEKGQCVKWDRSEFADYEKKDVLVQLYGEIELMRIDEGGLNKKWRSYSEFIDWLIKELG